MLLGPTAVLSALLTGLFLASSPAIAASSNVEIDVSDSHVGMGRSVEVRAHARVPGGRPAVGVLLLPYVNGARWGAHEYTDEKGKAVFHIPLPNPGRSEIVVEAREVGAGREEWIWSPEVADNQVAYLHHAFDLPGDATDATLWCAVDDSATVFLNGAEVGDFGGWMDLKPVGGLSGLLRSGENTLCVEARNGTGPAGLLLRLEIQRASGLQVVATGPDWRSHSQPPADWPRSAPATGEDVQALGSALQALWASAMDSWPSADLRRSLFAGALLPEGARTSNAVHVDVRRRQLVSPPADPEHLIGMQWEPWFTPHNANWATGQAVPLTGLYWSWNRDVLRQHMIWLIESGIDFLIVDWTNHLWDKAHWDERPNGTNEIILATTLAFETLATLRDEGHRVPKMVLYPGLNNGPTTTMQAVNEELAWIYHNYVSNPRFDGLFVEYLGKPLIIIHNGAGPDWLDTNPGAPLDDEHFTVRWHSSQNDSGKLNERGYWSWMDGALEPAVTYFEGEPECLTVSTAFFSHGGWLAETAFGRRGGWTYIESFKSALQHRPRFIEIHQFQEFAGQPEGSGYGPNHDIYVDSYSVEMSDDIEPVSLTAPAYRGDGGWGFLYLNLTRALVDLYRQETPETTVLALSQPRWRQEVAGDSLSVEWTFVGRPPESFTIEIDGHTIAEGLHGLAATVDVSDLDEGSHTLTLIAEGTKARYALSYTEDSLPDDRLPLARAEVRIVKTPAGR